MKEKKKIVLIGGGTGNAVFLRTLKYYPCEISAIVTVADDGGSSGTIRQDYGILPPGDIRNCIVALADEENIMAELMDYRFTDGFMKTQSFGNIMITAMHQISGNFPAAVRMVSDVLAVNGRVLPVTTQDIVLCAQLNSGRIIEGESKIPLYCASFHDKIQKMYLCPDNAEAYIECTEAIKEADIIVYSPGSLYTSLIPNLLVNGICEALTSSEAKKYYVQNIMTQNGETNGYRLSDHIKAIVKHAKGKNIIDTVVYNTGILPVDILNLYEKEDAYPVVNDVDSFDAIQFSFAGLEMVKIIDRKIRHDSKVFWDYVFNN